eukprot:9763568-Karenia_brevis.AAC.1
MTVTANHRASFLEHLGCPLVCIHIQTLLVTFMMVASMAKLLYQAGRHQSQGERSERGAC